jgi:hypothetical protein
VKGSLPTAQPKVVARDNNLSSEIFMGIRQDYA